MQYKEHQAPLWEKNFEEDDNILPETIAAPEQLQLRETYKEAYLTDRWFGPIWLAAQKPYDDRSLKDKVAMKYYSVMEDGLLYVASGGADAGQKRLCVPASMNNTLRKLILHQCHDDRLHGGRDKTFDRMSCHYYWPTMYNDVRRYVSSCASCRRNGAIITHPGGGNYK